VIFETKNKNTKDEKTDYLANKDPLWISLQKIGKSLGLVKAAKKGDLGHLGFDPRKLGFTGDVETNKGYTAVMDQIWAKFKKELPKEKQTEANRVPFINSIPQKK
jgi:biotin operon repressor